MAYEFLDALDLRSDEKATLRSLAARGSDTPFKLVALYQSSPIAFAALIGGEHRAAAIADQLREMLTDQERTLLAEKPAGFSTGALLDPPVPPTR